MPTLATLAYSPAEKRQPWPLSTVLCCVWLCCRRWRVPVKQHLLPGKNELLIFIAPAYWEALDRKNRHPYTIPTMVVGGLPLSPQRVVCSRSLVVVLLLQLLCGMHP